MQPDSLAYDTILSDTAENRPLPKWLTDQKSGITTMQAEELVMREDNSLKISFIVTGILVLAIVTILSIHFIRKHNKQAP